jgi:hypothetical protein
MKSLVCHVLWGMGAIVKRDTSAQERFPEEGRTSQLLTPSPGVVHLMANEKKHKLIPWVVYTFLITLPLGSAVGEKVSPRGIKTSIVVQEAEEGGVVCLTDGSPNLVNEMDGIRQQFRIAGRGVLHHVQEPLQEAPNHPGPLCPPRKAL